LAAQSATCERRAFAYSVHQGRCAQIEIGGDPGKSERRGPDVRIPVADFPMKR